jgi:hypothetical protein
MRLSSLQKLIKPCIIIGCAAVSLLSAEDKKIAQKVEGQIHANWHYNLTENAEPASKFDITRAYFGYKMTVNGRFTGRVMVDVGRLDEITGVIVDTSLGTALEKSKKSSRYVAFLKYGYLEWKGLIPKTALLFGMHGMNQFKYQEKFWGYRYIYMSLMDHYKYGSSADLGFTIKSKPVNQFGFNVSVVNGDGYKKPQDIDGKYNASLGTEIHIVEGLSTYLYGDIMPTKKENQFTVAGFLGYKLKKVWRLGAEYNYRGNHKGEKDSEMHGVSVYTTGTIKKFDIFARSDLFSEDTWGSFETLVLFGLQYAPIKNFKIAPNFQLILPAEDEADPEPKVFMSGIFKF